MVSYGLTLALYLIFSRTAFAVERRLTKAKILLTKDVITKAEYVKIREKILKDSGRI